MGADTTIFIPKGKFYVGWRQVSSSSPFGLYVGFDRDSPEATSRIYFNSTGTWNPISGGNIQGAIMIRPVFGSKVQVTTQTSQPAVRPESLSVYPNPTSDYLYFLNRHALGSEVKQLIAVNSLGQQYVLNTNGNKISVQNLSPGLYTLLLADEFGTILGQSRFVKK